MHSPRLTRPSAFLLISLLLNVSIISLAQPTGNSTTDSTKSCPALNISQAFQPFDQDLLKGLPPPPNNSDIFAQLEAIYLRKKSFPTLLKRSRLGIADPNDLEPPGSNMFAGEDPNWLLNYTKGIGRWNELQTSLKNIGPQDCPNNLADWTWSSEDTPGFTVRYVKECKSNGVLGILDENENRGKLPHNKLCANTYTSITQATRNGLPENTPRNIAFFYQNHYSTSADAIIAYNNYGRLKLPRDSPDAQWYPADKRWKDAAMAAWYKLSTEAGPQPYNLRFKTQMHVVNRPTVWVSTYVVIKNGIKSDLDGVYQIIFTPQDYDFYALLGTPNANSATSFLTDFAGLLSNSDTWGNLLSVKTIKSVTLTLEPQNGLLNMGFAFQDIKPP